MLTRQPIPADFVGKTIASVDVLGVNCLVFHFTDDSKVVLDVEHFGMGFQEIVVDLIDSLGVEGAQQS